MKIIGGFLMFVGGVIDFIQLFMIGTETDFETFRFMSIIGTVLFFVGLGIYSLSNGANKI